MKYLLSIFVFLPFLSIAQGPIPELNGIPNGSWMNTHIPTKRLIQYPAVSERDVLWSKRVWRAIDMRERINQPMYYPLDEVTELEWITNASRWSLWTIIRKHVMEWRFARFLSLQPRKLWTWSVGW